VKTGKFEVKKRIAENQETIQKKAELRSVANSRTNITKGTILNISDMEGNLPMHVAVTARYSYSVSYWMGAGSHSNTCNT